MPTTSPEGCENFRLPRLGPAKKTVIVVLLILSLPAYLPATFLGCYLLPRKPESMYIHMHGFAVEFLLLLLHIFFRRGHQARLAHLPIHN